MQQSAQKYAYFGYISRDNVALSVELHSLMLIYYSIEDLQEWLNTQRNNGKSIGLVPTMGALHEGHLSLIAKSKRDTDLTVCSIFVNPTQFNNLSDLENYPRTLEHDSVMLKQANCDVLFVPKVQEMYPEGQHSEDFNFGKLEHIMEGKHRPGHFNGVGTIVSKLFDIVAPDSAFFGEKDYQQLEVIKSLVDIKNYSIKIVACPIERAKDGLALSSRNARLSAPQRKAAPLIYRAIFQAKNGFSDITPKNLEARIASEINSNPELEVEYVEIYAIEPLERAHKWEDKKTYRVFVSAFCGDVRLIDNDQLN